MKFFKLLLICTSIYCITLFNVSSSLAEGIFTINNISIKGYGSSSKVAREKALADGEKRAFIRVLKKITPSYEHQSLPQLTSEEIKPLVQSFDVEEEKVTGNHYSAVLGIAFNGNQVRSLLKENGIEFVASSTEPILFVPVVFDQEKKEFSLGKNAGLFYNILRDKSRNSGYIKYKLLNGDEEDASIFSPAAPYIDGEGKAKLLSKYRASDIIVLAVTYLSGNQGEVVVNVKASPIDSRLFAAKENTVGGNIGEEVESVADKAIVLLLKDLESKWKSRSFRTQSRNQSIDVVVPIDGLMQWKSILARLDKINSINNYDIAQLTTRQGDLSINFNSDYNELLDRLYSAGLLIDNIDNTLYLRESVEENTDNNSNNKWF